MKAEKVIPSFVLGDRVSWTSQSQGSKRTKTGTIVEVVRTLGKPDRYMFPSLYKGSGIGSSREGPSYVVAVPGKKTAVKHYWPFAHKLVPAPNIAA